jgi:hypothetical protein
MLILCAESRFKLKNCWSLFLTKTSKLLKKIYSANPRKLVSEYATESGRDKCPAPRSFRQSTDKQVHVFDRFVQCCKTLGDFFAQDFTPKFGERGNLKIGTL